MGRKTNRLLIKMKGKKSSPNRLHQRKRSGYENLLSEVATLIEIFTDKSHDTGGIRTQDFRHREDLSICGSLPTAPVTPGLIPVCPELDIYAAVC